MVCDLGEAMKTSIEADPIQEREHLPLWELLEYGGRSRCATTVTVGYRRSRCVARSKIEEDEDQIKIRVGSDSGPVLGVWACLVVVWD